MPTKKKEEKSNALILVERFSSLAKYTSDLVFPDYRNGILSKPNSSNWGKVRQVAYQTAHPALFINDQKIWQFIAYIILSFSSLVQLALSLLFLDPKYYSPLNETASPVEINSVVIGITIITTILILPVILFWWGEIITDIRYLLWHKILIVASLIISLYSFANTISLKANFDDWINLNNHLLLVFAILVFPAMSFVLSIAVDLILSGYYLLRVVLGGIFSLHNPLPFTEIKKLLQENIPLHETTGSWKISDLSSSEISSLHQWAVTNREATEKRAIPLSIGLGLFGVVTFSDTIRTIADGFITWFLDILAAFIKTPFSLPLQTVLLSFSILLVFIIFIGSITRSLLSLFVNISVQNVIIETCVIAIQSKTKGK